MVAARFLQVLGLMALSSLPTVVAISAIAEEQAPALFRRSQPTTQVLPITEAVEPSIPALEHAVYEQINQHRATLGLAPLRLDTRISISARSHSQNMADRRIPFGHSNFRQRVLALDRLVPSRRISENVAYMFTHRETAKRVVQGWLRSPAHRPSIEGREYRLTGVGVAKGERGAFYVTQIYIRPH
jgi:uncharacterized protein YkwD